VHERVYGYARAQQPAEFVNFRAVHTFPLPAPRVRSAAHGSCTIDEARIGQRPVYFAPGGFVRTAIYDRARLSSGDAVDGPAIIEQMDTTTVIAPGYTATVDPASNLRIRRRQR
jgi:N-methylhydantoinase A